MPRTSWAKLLSNKAKESNGGTPGKGNFKNGWRWKKTRNTCGKHKLYLHKHQHQRKSIWRMVTNWRRWGRRCPGAMALACHKNWKNNGGLVSPADKNSASTLTSIEDEVQVRESGLVWNEERGTNSKDCPVGKIHWYPSKLDQRNREWVNSVCEQPYRNGTKDPSSNVGIPRLHLTTNITTINRCAWVSYPPGGGNQTNTLR